MIWQLGRRATAILTASALFATSSAQALADAKPYFRANGSGAPASSANPTDPTDDTDKSGGLTVTQVPASVRARIGVPFAMNAGVEGSNGSVTWDLAGSGLPAGLTLSPSGAIQGVPQALERAAGVRLKAADSQGRYGLSRTFTLDVKPTPTVEVTPAARTLAVGDVVSITPAVSDIYGSASWTLSGRLPFGLGFDPSTGRISGTPEQEGTFEGLRLSVIDADGANGMSAAFAFTVTSELKIGGYSNAYRMRAGKQFAMTQPFATGATGAVRWSLASGDLPAGVAVDPSSGALVGTPTAPGASEIRVRAADQRTTKSVVSNPLSLEVLGDPTATIASRSIGRMGSTMTVTASVTGIIGTPQWRVGSGILPNGLSVSGTAGSITGMPQTAGVTNGVSLRVTDSRDAAVANTNPATFEVLRKLTVGGFATPYAKVGEQVSSALPTVSGLYGAPTWSATNLPAGLAIDQASQKIVGVPTTAGNRNFTLTVTDAYDGKQDSRTQSFLISPADEVPPFAITGVAETAYGLTGETFFSQQPRVTGASGAVSFSLASGTLPDGFSLDTSTGVISGVTGSPASAAGLRLRARDAATADSVVSDQFSIVIQSPQPLSMTLASSSVTVDDDFSLKPTVTAGARPMTFVIASGQLPGWAALDAATGEISGVATQLGESVDLVLSVMDGRGDVALSNPFSIVVNPKPSPTISDVADRYYATVGSAFATRAPTVRNAQAPAVWSIAEGALPEWAELNTANGQISGTPGAGGSASGIVLRVTDARGISADSPAFAITTAPQALQATIAQSRFVARTGATLTTPSPTIVGATSSVSYSLAAGSLPAGFGMNPSTGVIAGASGEKLLRTGLIIKVTEAGSGRSALTEAFALQVVGTNPAISVQTSYPGTVGWTFEGQPQASDVVGAPDWSLASGTLPAGLSINPASGAIEGAPTAAGTQAGLSLRLVDADGAVATSATFSIVVTPDTSIRVSAFDALGRVGGQVSMTPSASPQANYAWTIVPALPAGLGLDPQTGAITGSSATALEGRYTLTATNIDQESGSRQITVAVRPPLTASAASSYRIHPLSPFIAAQPTVANGAGDITWSVASGLPDGLSADATSGVVSGTPTAEGQFRYALTATDSSDGARASTTDISLSVEPQPTIGVAASYPARAGFAFSAQPTAQNAIGTSTWSLAAGVLPVWASLNAANGQITGTPASEGRIEGLSLKVVDERGGAAISSAFSIDVSQSFEVAWGDQTYSARVGKTFSSRLPTPSGQSGAVTWELAEGQLPSWATLNASTGVISGSPAAVETIVGLKLRGRDATGATATSPAFTISIQTNPVVAIASQTTRVSAKFSATPSVTGAIGGKSFSLATGSLPTWAAFNTQTGEISGRPTEETVTAGLSIKVVDGEGVAGVSDPFSITVTSGFTIAGVDQVYTGRAGRGFVGPRPAANGAVGALSWKFYSNPPTWVSLNASTGAVAGVPNAAGLTTNQALTATDASDGAVSTSPSFSIDIKGNLVAQNVPSAYVAHAGKPYASPAPFAAGLGGTATWALAAGALPTWATLNGGTGQITGTPPADAGASGLSLRLTDSMDGESVTSGTFALNVSPNIEVVDVPTGYTARYGFAFSSAAPTARYAHGAPTWTIATGALPAWASVNPATGQIVGTPDVLGTTTGLGLRATDASGGDGSSVAFSLNVYNQPAASVALTSYKLRVGSDFTLTPTVTGIAGTPQWSLAAGALPNGLGVNPSTGVISGQPTAADYQPLALRVQDASDGASAETQGFTLEVSDALKVTGFDSYYRGRQGKYMVLPTPTLQNARGAVTRARGGALPSGMSFDAATGVFSGTPSSITTAPATMYVRMTDGFDGAYADGSFTWEVVGALNVGSLAARTTRKGTQFTQAAPSVANFVKTKADLQWSLGGGTLPAGLDLSQATGDLAGTPTEAGQFSILHRAVDTDNAQDLSNSYFVLTVLDDLKIAGASPVNQDQNVAFSNASYTATGVGGNTTWSAAGLPNGVTLSGAGASRSLSGTPTAYGTYSATLTVTDDFDGKTANLPVTINVVQAPTLAFVNSTNTITAKAGTGTATCTNVAIRNDGPRDATGLTAAIVTDATHFETCVAPTNACSTLAVGATCNIGVRMASTDNGAFTGQVKVSSSNGGSATGNVSGQINGVLSAGYQVFTTAGSFSFTPQRANMTVKVLVIGGGAGGGGTSGSNSGTAGGGGGGAGRTVTSTVTIAGPVNVVVGEGGSGGAAGVYGTAGFSSSFGDVSATGGSPGGPGNGGAGSSGGGGVSSTSAAGNAPHGGYQGSNGFGLTNKGLGMGEPAMTAIVNQFAANSASGFLGVARPTQGGSGNGSSSTTAAGGKDCWRSGGGGGASGLIVNNAATPMPYASNGTAPGAGNYGNAGRGYGAGGGGGGQYIPANRGCPTTYTGAGGDGADGAVIVTWEDQ